jgi:hypothetical protein
MVHENDSAFAHGRIPAHEIRDALEVSLLLLQAKAKQSRNQARLFEFGFDVMEIFHQQSSLPIAARAYMFMISDHYMLYDHFSRPYKL